MNIEKIFSALEKDEVNSALGTICAELEKQGYTVKINNIEVTAEELFDKRLESLEQSSQDFNISLNKNNKYAQEFSIRFIDYHSIVFKPKNRTLNYSFRYDS